MNYKIEIGTKSKDFDDFLKTCEETIAEMRAAWGKRNAVIKKSVNVNWSAEMQQKDVDQMRAKYNQNHPES